jgi:hypothetical protein
MSKAPTFRYRYQRTLLNLFILSMLLLVLTNCQHADQAITLSQALENSCLRNIVPGASAEGLVKPALETCKTINQDSVMRSTGKIGSKSGISYTWTAAPSQRGKINLVDGVVNLISLQMESGSDLGTFLDELGSPESMYISYQIHENCVADITLDYPNQGLSLGATKAFECSAIGNDGLAKLVLDATTHVSEYYLYQAGNLDDVLTNVFLMTEQNIARNQNYRRPWQGFGAIQVKPLE